MIRKTLTIEAATSNSILPGQCLHKYLRCSVMARVNPSEIAWLMVDQYACCSSRKMLPASYSIAAESAYQTRQIRKVTFLICLSDMLIQRRDSNSFPAKITYLLGSRYRMVIVSQIIILERSQLPLHTVICGIQ